MRCERPRLLEVEPTTSWHDSPSSDLFAFLVFAAVVVFLIPLLLIFSFSLLPRFPSLIYRLRERNGSDGRQRERERET